MKVRELIKYLSLFDAEANVILPANSLTGEERLTKEHIKSGLGVLIFDCVNRKQLMEENERLEAVITRLIDQAIQGAAENAQLKKDNARLKEDKIKMTEQLQNWGQYMDRQYAEIAKLKCTLTRLQGDKIKTDRELNRQYVNQLKDTIADLNAKISKSWEVGQIEILVEKVRRLTELRAEETYEYEQRLQRQRIEIQRLLEVNVHWKRENEQLKEEKAIKIKQLINGGRRICEQHNEIGQLKCTITDLNTQLERDDCRQYINQLREQNAAMVSIVNTSCAQILELSKENRQLKKQNTTLIADLNARLFVGGRLRMENSRLRKKNERLDNLLNVRAEQLGKRIDEMEDNAGG